MNSLAPTPTKSGTITLFDPTHILNQLSKTGSRRVFVKNPIRFGRTRLYSERKPHGLWTALGIKDGDETIESRFGYIDLGHEERSTGEGILTYELLIVRFGKLGIPGEGSRGGRVEIEINFEDGALYPKTPKITRQDYAVNRASRPAADFSIALPTEYFLREG